MSQFVVVHHTMNEGKAGDWWKAIKEGGAELMKTASEKNAELGLHNHSFMPITNDLIYCLWEVKQGVDLSVLQGHLDAFIGMSMMKNEMHVVAVEKAGSPPAPRHFA